MSTLHSLRSRLLPLAAVFAAACGGAAATPDAGPAVAPARLVVVASAEPAPFPRTALLQGTLEPEHVVQLAARVDGPLLDVTADLGDTVRRGELLARIDSTDARSRALQARIDLDTAREDLARYAGLDPVDAVSRQSVAQAEARVASAEAALELANNSVSYARVVAPWDGAVMRRYVERGAYVRAGTALFDLVSTGPLRLGLEVPEVNIRDVRVGSKLIVIPGEGGEPRFEATVSRVAPAIAAASRTFRIEATVDPHDGQLRPGMFVVAVLELGMSQDAVRVPRSAVFSVLGRDRVVRVLDGKATPTEVTLLGEHDGFAFVDGLAPGSPVVTRGAGALAPGAPLRTSTEAPGGGTAAPTPAAPAAGAQR